MGFIQGEGRTQRTLFPVTLDELIPEDHVCRVSDGFVDRLDMAGLGFERAEPAETGRPGYDPRDLLKLYFSRSAPRGGWKPSVSVTWK
jgi:transposase